MKSLKAQYDDNHKTNYIAGLLSDLARTPWGAEYLDILEKSNCPVLPMPEEYMLSFPFSPALFVREPETRIYLSDSSTLDQLCHEIAHLDQLSKFPPDLINPSDMKHLYIQLAIGEADAYAQQCAVVIEMLSSDNNFMDKTKGIYTKYTQDGQVDHMSPLNVGFFHYLQKSPEQIKKECETDPESKLRYMRAIFYYIFLDIIPHLYEQDLLNTIFTKLNSDMEQFKTRQARYGALIQKDLVYFAECSQSLNRIIGSKNVNYITDPSTNSPSSRDLIQSIMSEDVIDELKHLDQQLGAFTRAAHPKSSPN